mmetsp:Transcript_4971/g.13175  ORF Transcript_4971/g.13175 Transcript_4971/m.13175 type:complete len:80 (+) Transcript_4971:357-596(+)
MVCFRVYRSSSLRSSSSPQPQNVRKAALEICRLWEQNGGTFLKADTPSLRVSTSQEASIEIQMTYEMHLAHMQITKLTA